MESILSFLKIRPAFKLVLLLIAGSTIGYYFDVSPTILCFVVFTVFIASTIFLCVKVSLLNFSLIIAVILAGTLRYELATRVFRHNHIIHFLDLNETVTIQGKVVGFPHSKKNRIEFELEVSELISQKDNIATCGKILVRLWRANLLPDNGDRLQITGKIQEPRGERNPGDFNYKKFLAANGIYGIVNISRPQDLIVVPAVHKKSLAYFIYLVKRKFYRSFNQMHRGQAQALVKGLLLGERGEISPELQDAFSKCGVIHILAISGLNIGYIGIIFFVLFGLLRLNYQAKIIAVIISVFFYNLLVGFEPPIVRASLMMGIFLFGRLLQRRTDPLNVISAAAVIILLINPPELFQVSFQLSFGAILSMAYLYQRLKIIFEKWALFGKLTQTKLGEYLGTLLLVTLAAQLGTLPIVVYYFHRISLIGIILNLLVIPLTGIITALGLATMFFSFVSVTLAQLYANTNTICLELLIRVVEWSSKISFSAITIGRIGLVTVLIFYLMLWSLLNFHRVFYRKVVAFSILTGAMLLTWQAVFQSHNWMQVIFFDVGQGDAALVTFPNGKNMLIDGGPVLEDFDAGEFFILPYLKRERINRLNTVVVSHADNDHIGGIPSILRSLPVDKVFDNGLFNESGICSTYQVIIDSFKIDYQVAQAGYRLTSYENCGVYFLHPGKVFASQFKADINNCSVVAKIVYGNRSFLFPGDIGSEAEKILLCYGELLKADVLKVAHHGSRTSSSEAWLKLVQPEFAVISVGRNNKFNFPAPSVLKRFQQLGIKTIQTDVNGAVIFRTDGTRLERIR